MKYVLYTILALNFYGFVALAQDKTLPPPPPPPLIYKSPEKDSLKEFISEDKNFQITFPGAPVVAKQEVNNVTVTIYKVYRQGSNSVVNTYDFAANMEENREKLFEAIKASFIKDPKATIEAENDILIEGKSGKEIDVLDGYVYRKVRFFVSGRRLYEIKTDVTNWHIIEDSTKKLYFDDTEKFFDSFKIL